MAGVSCFFFLLFYITLLTLTCQTFCKSVSLYMLDFHFFAVGVCRCQSVES